MAGLGSEKKAHPGPQKEEDPDPTPYFHPSEKHSDVDDDCTHPSDDTTSTTHHFDSDIDHVEAEGAVPGHLLDTELGHHRHSTPSLRRLESLGTVRSRVSRALSIVSNRPPTERIPFDPIPTTDLSSGTIGWDSQDDPDMPLNWTRRKKWTIMGFLSLITLLTPFASSILAPGIWAVNEEFGNENDIVGAMTVSIYLLGYTVGPLFLAPLSEIYGRRLVLAGANAFFCVWQVGCALAPNVAALIVFRFLCGIGGAGCLTLGAGVISDLFRADERGFAVGIYTIGPLIGPTVGPIVGSFVSQNLGWRWDFWIVFIVGVAVCGLAECFNRETNWRVLMARKVARMRRELGRDDLHSCYDDAAANQHGEKPSHKRVLLNGLVRPTKLLFLSPLVFFVSLYIAFTYGTLYLLLTTMSVVFQETYGWGTGTSGLIFLSLGIGNFIGWAAVTSSSDRGVIRRTRANGGVFVPEFRLPLSVWYSLMLPPTFFWYGWAAHYHAHWAVTVLSFLPFSIGVIGIFMPLTTYLVDCYPSYAASAIAANTVFRSLAGMLVPLAGPSMYQNLGLGWGNSLLGFLCVAMIPVPILLHRFGGRLRKMGLQL